MVNNNNLISYKNDKKNSSAPDSFILGNLYENGYNLLWSFGNNPNPFFVYSHFWLKEEERRAFIFQYWKRLNVTPPIKVSEVYMKEKVREDIRSFTFLILYINFSSKQILKNRLPLDRSLYSLYLKYSLFLIKNKEYSNYFLKQPSIYLKKYEALKNIYERNLVFMENNYPFDFFFKLLLSPFNSFDYFYLFPDSLDKIFEKISKQSLFFRLYDRFTANIIFFKDNFSFRRFFSFLDAKFFPLNLDFFLRDVFLKKKTLNIHLFDIVESIIISDQNEYILKLDPYFDLTMFNEEYSFLLSEYLFFDFFELEEQILVRDSFSSIYDHFLFLIYEKNLTLFNSDVRSLRIEYFFDFSIFYQEIISISFNAIRNIPFFISLDSKDSYMYFSLSSLAQAMVSDLPKYYEESMVKKYPIPEQFGDSLNIFFKNLQYNPAAIRSLFIQKLIFIKEMGNIKKFNSYASFLEKYFYYNNYSSRKEHKLLRSYVFKSMVIKQKMYVESLNLFENSSFRWNFTVLDSFNNIRVSYILGYLNLVKFEEKSNYNLDNKDTQFLKDPIISELINLNNNASLLKYNLDFYSKIYIKDNLENSLDLFSFSDSLSFYNNDFFYLNFLIFIKRATTSLVSFK